MTRRLAHLEQHDHVHHEHHHRAHVDQHLEGGDKVHAQQSINATQHDHRRDQRQRDAHGLANHEHQHGREEGDDTHQAQNQCVDDSRPRRMLSLTVKATGFGGYGLSTSCFGFQVSISSIVSHML